MRRRSPSRTLVKSSRCICRAGQGHALRARSRPSSAQGMRCEPTAVGLVPVARAFRPGTGATPSALADYLTDALAAFPTVNPPGTPTLRRVEGAEKRLDTLVRTAAYMYKVGFYIFYLGHEAPQIEYGNISNTLGGSLFDLQARAVCRAAGSQTPSCAQGAQRPPQRPRQGRAPWRWPSRSLAPGPPAVDRGAPAPRVCR